MTRLWVGGQPLEIVSEDMPTKFNWQGRAHHITETCNRWRIDTCWWDPAQRVCREYLQIVTDTGLLCLLYRDADSRWFLARVYD